MTTTTTQDTTVHVHIARDTTCKNRTARWEARIGTGGRVYAHRIDTNDDDVTARAECWLATYGVTVEAWDRIEATGNFVARGVTLGGTS